MVPSEVSSEILGRENRCELKCVDRLVVARAIDSSDAMRGDQTLVVLVAWLASYTQDPWHCDGVARYPKEPQIPTPDRRGNICGRIRTLEAS